MPLITALAALCSVGLFCLLVIAVGHRLLRFCKVGSSSHLEHILCCAALGVVFFETAVFFLQAARSLGIGLIFLIAAGTLAGALELPLIRPRLAALAHSIFSGSRGEKFLTAGILTVLLFEGIAAVAPLTGSDALHYHFTAPSLILREGWHPNFFLPHSFFTGQGHLLILSGLALGSEKLALGLLFLGGVLSAAATACLARQWVSPLGARLTALSFLLTPVVFWQMTSAGAPDVWMAFFAATGVLVVARCRIEDRPALAALAGVIAGAAAGTKYTGCIIAASLALAFLWETRSVRRLLIFLGGALSAGVWPYARNFLWTGDPFFPRFAQWMAHGPINGYALRSILADTGATGSRSLWQIAKFPFFAAVDESHLGFWQFFGPLCLLFAPLVILAVRNTPHWRAALIVWLAGSLGIGASSGMTRFLLPLLPIALAAAFAGAATLREREWRVAQGISALSIGLFLCMGAGGLVWYGRAAAAAALGLTSREDYLLHRAPDYAISEFVNRALAGKSSEGNALVFFRHLYYLQVPYLYGDPQESWAVDPARLATPEDWREFFRRNLIRWVVRAPDYPEAIAAPLEQLERDGTLTPAAREDVSTFEGMRILGIRKTVSATIFRVND